MTTTLKAANDAMRRAVETRLAKTPADDATTGDHTHRPAPVDWLLQAENERRATSESYAEWEPPGFAATRAEQALHGAIAAVRDRHGKYGPPTEHFARTAALVNAAFNTSFTAADWALVMVLDKIARQRGPGATDDAAIDIAGYAACHQECRQSQ
jgi:hypothetical protein